MMDATHIDGKNSHNHKLQVLSDRRFKVAVAKIIIIIVCNFHI